MSLNKWTWALVLFLVVIAASMGMAVGAHHLKVSRGYAEFVAGTARTEQIPLAPAPLNPSWIISGSPVCQSLQFASAFDRSSSSGIWQCAGPATFEFHYQSEETVYILEGYAEIEYLGKRLTLEPGTSTSFAFGTKALWTVPERIRKTWWIHSDPGFSANVARRLNKVSDPAPSAE